MITTMKTTRQMSEKLGFCHATICHFFRKLHQEYPDAGYLKRQARTWIFFDTPEAMAALNTVINSRKKPGRKSKKETGK